MEHGQQSSDNGESEIFLRILESISPEGLQTDVGRTTLRSLVLLHGDSFEKYLDQLASSEDLAVQLCSYLSCGETDVVIFGGKMLVILARADEQRATAIWQEFQNADSDLAGESVVSLQDELNHVRGTDVLAGNLSPQIRAILESEESARFYMDVVLPTI